MSSAASPITPGPRRQHLPPPLLLALLVALSGQVRAETFLSIIGGAGGSEFIARCPTGQNLTGFELRAGDDVDAIRPVCVVSLGPTEVSVPPVTTEWHGGSGGKIVSLLCPANTPIVLGVDVLWEGINTYTVNSIWLFCGQAVAAQPAAADPSAVFDAPRGRGNNGSALLLGSDARAVGSGMERQRCPAGQVAVAMRGRYGVWLDAMGLICDAPRLTRPAAGGPGKSIGRAGPSMTAGPKRPICDIAREARARNNTAASGLEAQCLAHLAALRAAVVPITPTRRGGNQAYTVGPAPATAQPAFVAVSAETLDSLADQGEAIAAADRLSAELRNRSSDELSRRGFDIGMAAAEGNTEPGPGKRRIHDSLSPEEQPGFEIAVSFSLQRNRNAQLATTGAAIAGVDAVVAQARTIDRDVFYWLGFDIATGLFGDPALGAAGNTAVGPGSLGIRNALSANAQRGFNAAVALHSRRNYRR